MVFSGNSNPKLSGEICGFLGLPLGRARVDRFMDGEVRVEIRENVRGRDVFVVQSTSAPVNDHLMELLVMIDALHRASAQRITAVIPYYGYARQDRKVVPRTPISAKLVANLITAAGASRVLTIDLHAGQIQGFFDIPVDNLYAKPVLLSYLRQVASADVVMVAPDAGGTERARGFAKEINASIAVVDKRRDAPNQSRVMNVVGEVAGKTAVICDDMIDTGGTLIHAASALIAKGATRVCACCTHAVLSGEAVKRIQESDDLHEIVATNTVPLRAEAKGCAKIKSLSVAPLLAESIRRIHEGDSLSTLFD